MYYIMMDQILGSGTFSKVYLGEMEPEKVEMYKRKQAMMPVENKYAIKEIANQTLIEKLGMKGQETLKKEVDISMLLHHPNIVKLYDFIKT